MAFHNSNIGGSANASNGSNLRCVSEYSGDERDSRSGGEERPDDLTDKPVYLLEHLATFTVNKDSGIVFPADGMRRLLQLEKTTGIWSQKMQLCLDYPWILIMDYETGNVIERFPASLIQEPTAFTSTDSMELYNNILVFIVSGGSSVRSEMHIFQSQSISAVDLVEDLKMLRGGKIITVQREPANLKKLQNKHLTMNKISMHSGAEQSGMEQYEIRSNDMNIEEGVGCETDSDHGGGPNDETSSISSEKYERDVAVLNHCFDDIEKFIARLQHAAAATRELERRRRNRKTKKKDPGEGLLTLRTRPPHEKEFIDIFAKFKLSFNLLAKLKAHIHDPNAPELVHFLFTPLALIVEASSDTYYETQLPSRVTSPLLTREAVNLLINCVTSKETELWRSLGDVWIIPRDEWKDEVGSYHPVFLDGWSPDYLVNDELETTTTTTPTNVTNKRHLDIRNNGHTSRSMVLTSNRIANSFDEYNGSSTSQNNKYSGMHVQGADCIIERDDQCAESLEGDSTNHTVLQPNAVALNSITKGLQKLQAREPRSRTENFAYNGNNSNGMHPQVTRTLRNTSHPMANTNDEKSVESWLEELQSAGAKIVLVTYPRTANNDKELTVVRGEYLEILDDSRKWWKARNILGNVAHVPHTIVTPCKLNDLDLNKTSQQQNNYKPKNAPYSIIEDNAEPPSPETTDWIRQRHLGKKGEFRYF